MGQLCRVTAVAPHFMVAGLFIFSIFAEHGNGAVLVAILVMDFAARLAAAGTFESVGADQAVSMRRDYAVVA